MDTQLKESLTMKNVTGNRQRGIALFFSIFALLLLTAIAAALIFMANTETSVNSNYRQEQVAYFAAKAGIEEARARMMASDPNPIALPTVAPTNLNGQIIYIVNPVKNGTAVQPWNAANQWTDDELCHDYNLGSLGLTTVAPDVHCATTTLPATAYVSVNSQLPYNATATPVPYKWVRIAPKVNGSLLGPGTTITNTAYDVNAGVGTGITPVCWDGVNEWVLTAANCAAMPSANSTYMTNVYILTSFGVSSDAPNAARKVLQTEVALSPTSPFPYGLFATSTACPAVSFSGNNASTDSYTTAGGGTYATTQSNAGGDVGSNGGVSVGNGNIGGIVGVLQPVAQGGKGTCATPLTLGPNGSNIGPPPCPGPKPPCVMNTPTYVPNPYVFPTPPAPNPLPPTTAYAGGNNLVPGSYGNISITGNTTLTLAPGTYNINSISMAGHGEISVSPPGAVVLNIAGQGNANPVAIAGNGIIDDTIPNDFTINYGGTGTVSIAGNGDVTAMLNAPNAPVTQVGNGNWYGAILASTVSITGNGFFHFDRNAALSPPSNGYFTLISFREVPY
jgi:type IV pilus assembly PilX-like protein